MGFSPGASTFITADVAAAIAPVEPGALRWTRSPTAWVPLG
jgi:hypothetical protein